MEGPPRNARLHGPLPDYVPDNWDDEYLEELEDDLETSIRNRESVQRQKGESSPRGAGHRRRIDEERRLLRQVKKRLGRS
jgi:hypothetical protein